uniref:Uncharacterized protein n=1 Tax=Anopheles arabiensis TaxID=7173 RepID=A0A182IGF6_ANOAR
MAMTMPPFSMNMAAGYSFIIAYTWNSGKASRITSVTACAPHAVLSSPPIDCVHYLPPLYGLTPLSPSTAASCSSAMASVVAY